MIMMKNIRKSNLIGMIIYLNKTNRTIEIHNGTIVFRVVFMKIANVSRKFT